MEHLWSLICQQAIINQQTNNVSLIEILERLEFETDPSLGDVSEGLIPLPIVLVSTWMRSEPGKPERLPIRVMIKTPDGKAITPETPEAYEIDLEQHQSMRVTFSIPALPYKGDGRYSFEVQRQTNNKWRMVTAVPLTIIRRMSPNST